MLYRLSIRVAALAVLWCSSQAALAARTAESLFPDTTVGFLSIPDTDRLSAQWDKTQLGKLVLDPVMKDFVDDFKAQLRNKWSGQLDRIGLTIDDLENVPGGELGIGLIRAGKDQAASALVVDITGHEKQADDLLAKIERNMAKQKAARAVRQVGGVKLTVYTLPPHEGHTQPRHAVFFVRENMLCASDNVAVSEAMVARFVSNPKDSLGNRPAYRGVMDRAQQAVDTASKSRDVAVATDNPAAPAVIVTPELRWFIEPFNYIETSRLADPHYKKKKGKDMAKILASQGFDAVQGVGGYVHLYIDGYDVLHRTFVYAPPVKDALPEERYLLAARMLRFPNGGDLDPQSWVPRELATYISFNCEIRPAFEYSKSLVDAIVGEPVFDDVIQGLKVDANGPQIDIRADLLAHLGTRVTVVSDYELPITPKSERILVAVDATDAAALAKTVDKAMENDEDAHKREFEGITVWEIIDPEDDVPQIQVERPNLNPLQEDGEKDPTEKRKIHNAAVCVAHGHLFVATHIDFLKKILVTKELREQLGRSGEYRLTMEELDHTAALNPGSFRLFSRTEEEYRPTYELIRTGQMPESRTVFGRILNSMLGSGKEGEVRTQKIDGKKLPDFELVRRYFGPAGTLVFTEDKGWFIQGILLSKEAPQPEQGGDAPAEAGPNATQADRHPSRS